MKRNEMFVFLVGIFGFWWSILKNVFKNCLFDWIEEMIICLCWGIKGIIGCFWDRFVLCNCIVYNIKYILCIKNSKFFLGFCYEVVEWWEV